MSSSRDITKLITQIKLRSVFALFGSGGGGTGDVAGPASSVDNRVVFFSGATGKLIKDSGLTLSGSNTGDETTSTIKTKLGITTLSGSNTGDETAATVAAKLGYSRSFLFMGG